jgi:hypothetical protein
MGVYLKREGDPPIRAVPPDHVERETARIGTYRSKSYEHRGS